MRDFRRTLVLAFGATLLIGAASAAAQQPGDCGYYTNRYGDSVPSPCGNRRAEPPPPGEQAICRDCRATDETGPLATIGSGPSH